MIYERAFMEGELDPFTFSLAENLHMTVAQLEATMSNAEYLQWAAFFTYRKAMAELNG